MTQATIFACLGKGGVGKTAITALMGLIAISQKKKLLFIDADPAMGLTTTLGITKFKTLGQSREEIIREAKNNPKAVEESIDYILLETLLETPSHSALIMGQTNTLGCFCPVNTLLRKTIQNIAMNFDIIIIDAEAGIEQVSRQVVEKVAYPIIISDNSLRGIKTAITIANTLKQIPQLQPKKCGLLLNRVETPNQAIINEITNSKLDYYGYIPVDSEITQMDTEGVSLLKISENSVAIQALRTILTLNFPRL